MDEEDTRILQFKDNNMSWQTLSDVVGFDMSSLQHRMEELDKRTNELYSKLTEMENLIQFRVPDPYSFQLQDIATKQISSHYLLKNTNKIFNPRTQKYLHNIDEEQTLSESSWAFVKTKVPHEYDLYLNATTLCGRYKIVGNKKSVLVICVTKL